MTASYGAMIRNSVIQMETIQNAIISFLMYSVVIWPLSPGLFGSLQLTNQNANHLSLCNFIMIIIIILYIETDSLQAPGFLIFDPRIIFFFSN